MRILADLPDSDVKWLDHRAGELGKSRAALLREAVVAFRESERDWLEQGFGLWTRYGFGIDGAAYEDAVRSQWSRDGDSDAGGVVDDTPEDAVVDSADGADALEQADDPEATDEPADVDPAEEAYTEDEPEETGRRRWFR